MIACPVERHTGAAGKAVTVTLGHQPASQTPAAACPLHHPLRNNPPPKTDNRAGQTGLVKPPPPNLQPQLEAPRPGTSAGPNRDATPPDADPRLNRRRAPTGAPPIVAPRPKRRRAPTCAPPNRGATPPGTPLGPALRSRASATIGSCTGSKGMCHDWGLPTPPYTDPPPIPTEEPQQVAPPRPRPPHRPLDWDTSHALFGRPVIAWS